MSKFYDAKNFAVSFRTGTLTIILEDYMQDKMDYTAYHHIEEGSIIIEDNLIIVIGDEIQYETIYYTDRVIEFEDALRYEESAYKEKYWWILGRRVYLKMGTFPLRKREKIRFQSTNWNIIGDLNKN